MQYKTFYDSPLGKITLVADGKNLVGLWLEGQKYFCAQPTKKCKKTILCQYLKTL